MPRLLQPEPRMLRQTKATLSATANGLEGILIEGETQMNYGFKISTSEADVENGINYPILPVPRPSVNVEGLLPELLTIIHHILSRDGFVYGETKSFTTPAQTMEYVDLGLSILWAKCNLGAESEKKTGTLLGYGDLTGESEYLSIDYNTVEDIAGTDKDILKKVNVDGCLDAQFYSYSRSDE